MRNRAATPGVEALTLVQRADIGAVAGLVYEASQAMDGALARAKLKSLRERIAEFTVAPAMTAEFERQIRERIFREGLQNVAGGDHHQLQTRGPGGRFGPMMSGFSAHSEHQGDGLPTVTDVVATFDSKAHQEARDLSQMIDEELGLMGQHIYVIGDFDGYKENSLLIQYTGELDLGDLEYATAQKGVINNQVSTLAFKFDPNGDSVGMIATGFTDVDDARSWLDSKGLTARSIEQRSNGVAAWLLPDGQNEAFEKIYENGSQDTSKSFTSFRGTRLSLGDWETFDRETGVAQQTAIIDKHRAERL